MDLKNLKYIRTKLIKEFNKKNDILFEIKHSLIMIDESYEDLYNDDSIEEKFNDIEIMDYNTIEECQNIITLLEDVTKEIDNEITRCNKILKKLSSKQESNEETSYILINLFNNSSKNDKHLEEEKVYEDYNYEEEELEEDDYYYEDLD